MEVLHARLDHGLRPLSLAAPPLTALVLDVELAAAEEYARRVYAGTGMIVRINPAVIRAMGADWRTWRAAGVRPVFSIVEGRRANFVELSFASFFVMDRP